MQKSKPEPSETAQDLRHQQQAMEWLDEIGIGFTLSTPSKRLPSSVRAVPRKDAA